MHLAVEELLQFTDEQRTRWEKWFRENGEELLRMPIQGERDNTIGALILDVFGPEWHAIRRLGGEPVVDYRNRPRYGIAELFGFGIESRNLMRRFIRQSRPEDWSRMVEFDAGGRVIHTSTRKAVLHVLVREIEHWAQLSRLMRERGFPPPANHDLLTSSALT